MATMASILMHLSSAVTGINNAGRVAIGWIARTDISDYSDNYKYFELPSFLDMRNENDGTTGSCGCTPGSGCTIEAVLSVDERGQMVLPKDVRQKAGIGSGDKLALISWEKDGEVCCLALMKVGSLSGMVREILGPLVQDQE
jgi:antitoxin PrlF